jgi:thioredoxin-related protein
MELQKRMDDAQKEWDMATHKYSRYPGTEEWRLFLDCKKKVLSLREEIALFDRPVCSEITLKIVPNYESNQIKEEINEKPTKNVFIFPHPKLTQKDERVLLFISEYPGSSFADFMRYGSFSKDEIRHILNKLMRIGLITKTDDKKYYTRKEKDDETANKNL